MSVTLILCAGALSAAVSAVLTPVAGRVAVRYGFVDQPNPRKVHSRPTPRIGGTAIGAATLFVLGLLALTSHSWRDAVLLSRAQILTVTAASLAVFILGFLDDILDIPGFYKLLALAGGAIAVCASGLRFHSDYLVTQGFHADKLEWAISLLWIVGVTVSINFLDGLDGLAAGLCGIGALATAIVAAHFGQVLVPLVAIALAGALVGFLIYNFHPATIFMGDCGSLFIGFVVSVCMLVEVRQSGTPASLLLPLLTLGVPLLDTLLTVVRRSVIHRRSLFAAEREHIHHRLLQLGLTQTQAVLLLYALAIAGALAGATFIFANTWMAAVSTVLYVVLLVGVFRMSGSTRAVETIAAVRRNRAMTSESRKYHKAFDDLQIRFARNVNFADWWTNVCEAASRLDFASITIPLNRRDGEVHVLRWSCEDALPPGIEVLRVSVPVPQRRAGGSLRAELEVAATTTLESAGNRVTLFSRLMGENGLNRLGTTKAESKSKSRAKKLQPAGEEMTTRNWLFRKKKTLVGNGQNGMALRQIDTRHPRVAIVHDFLYTYAGAERVLEQMLEVFPSADVFSLFDFVRPESRAFLKGKNVTTSFLQQMPFARRAHRMYLPLMPLAIEHLDVSQYDIVISSSYLAAKGVLTRSDQLHICYCHTPVRFAWDLQKQYLQETGLARGLKSIFVRLVLHYIRNWDVRSANNVDVFITNSRFVGHRIEKIYRRTSTPIYPPVDTEQFRPAGAKESFYLAASRMVPYKRIDLIVEAFTTRMPDKRLIVIGEGPEFEKIQAKAGPNVRLVGHQSFERLRHYMQMARAFVFAAEEDFGIAPVEAQACGTPVIALGRGGVAESVIDGQTGVLFNQQSVDAIVDAVERFESVSNWDPAVIRENAERFSAETFRTLFGDFVRSHWLKFVANRLELTKSDLSIDARLISPDLGTSHAKSKFSNAVPA